MVKNFSIVKLKQAHLLVNRLLENFTSKIGYFIKNLFIRTDYNPINALFIKLLDLTNLLYPFSDILYNNDKINKNLVCFGSMEGKKFIDSPKYLFLYLNSKSEYQCYWFTSSIDVYNELKSKNYNVVYNYSFKAIKILKFAGYIVFAWTCASDLIPIKFSKDTKFIHTWHGSQFKKLYADIGVINHEVNMNNYYFLLSPGKSMTPFIISGFKIAASHVISTGLPRNDMLFRSNPKYISLKFTSY